MSELSPLVDHPHISDDPIQWCFPEAPTSMSAMYAISGSSGLNINESEDL
jgi:hypothetical protein